MTSYLYDFFLPLAGLATFIFLLSLLQYGIKGAASDKSRNAEEEHHDPNKEDGNINQARSDSVSDAIHTYRRSRESDERERAKRERVTIVALVTTAAFAFLAAVAAIVSAVIFSGQLGEMHQASIDTTELVDTARDTEERQLRAYVSIAGYIELRCHSCNAGQFRPISPAPQYMMDNIITINIQNGGQTPAYNVYVEDSFYPATFEGSLPSGFAFPIIKPTEHMVSASRSIENGVGIVNAHETTPNPGPIQQSILDYIIRAQHHNVTLFYYGNIRYTDIFHKPRITPFCYEYLPDLPTEEQFAACDEHNTPPKDG